MNATLIDGRVVEASSQEFAHDCQRAIQCDQGCNGCDECTDYYCGDECEDEPREPPEYGCCLPPGECCMPGMHFPTECHTAADYQRRGR